MARPKPVDLEAVLLRIERLVQAHGAIPKNELPSLRRHLPALAARLEARGFEVGSNVRVPLAKQLLALTERGFVPAQGLERRLSGGTAREVKTAALSLAARGDLVCVVRESGMGFQRASDDVIDRRDLDELLRCLAVVTRLARRARASKAAPSVALLREDVVAPLARWVSSDRTSEVHRDARRGSLADSLSSEIRRRFRETPLPIRVPELLRAIHASPEEGKHALLEGAARGLFQLEPESGMGRLTPEDAALCPTGPTGTRLSWVVARPEKGIN